MLHGKIFRSTVAHGRIKSHRHQPRPRTIPGVHRVVTIDDVRKVIPIPTTARPSTTSRSSRIDKVHYVGEPVAVVLAADPHVAEEAAAADRRRIRGAAGRLRRGRGR